MKFGTWNSVAFSYAQMKFYLLLIHETEWHSDNKERLGQVCAVRRAVRHLRYSSVLSGSDTMTLPAASAAWKVARCVSKQLAHCLWNIPRPDNHPCTALGALSGGLASLIGWVAEPADRLLMSSFYASDPQFILYVACIIGITVPPSNLLTIRIAVRCTYLPCKAGFTFWNFGILQ